MQGTTSKMSHNSTVILVVRPLWGRSHVGALPRRSRPAVLSPLRYESGRPAVTIVRPLWGLTAEGIVPSAISLLLFLFFP